MDKPSSSYVKKLWKKNDEGLSLKAFARKHIDNENIGYLIKQWFQNKK